MKYSQFNSLLPHNEKYALYNSLEQKVIFLEPLLKELLETGKEENINDLETIHPDFFKYLVENKFLVPFNDDEVSKVKEISGRVDNNIDNFHLTINPTMNCNFKCWYCYETHIKDSRLSKTVLDSVNLLIKSKFEINKIKFFNLSFFGGEPLLYFDKNVIPIIDYINLKSNETSIPYTISFTTNGYLINDFFIEYFVKNNISAHLQITFDGYGEDHDKVRNVNKKKGSYEEIVKNIKKILEYDNFTLTARINYTSSNLLKSIKIVDDFKDLSNHSKGKILFDFHRVWQDDKELDITPILFDNSYKIKTLGFKSNVQYSPNNVLDSCYADKLNSATVNYNGDIFKCTARDFLPENRVGFLTENGEIIWENNHLETRMNAKFKNPPCLSCKILPLCNGGCSQHAIEHAETNTEYCVFDGIESEKDKIVMTKIDEILDQNK